MLKISFPSMGWSKIAFKSLLNKIPGIEIVDPPKLNSQIADLGIKNAPEFVCFPFKIVLGEFINLIENFGVKTLVMSVGCGPCRMGYYSPVLERIIKDLGYDDVEVIPLDQADLTTTEWMKTYDYLSKLTGKSVSLFEIWNMASIFFVKSNYIEKILYYEGLIRCREIHKGDTTKTVERLMSKLDNINSFLELQLFDKEILSEYRKIGIKRDFEPLRVTISGEIHVYLEPYVNMDIIKKFGDLGVEVHRAFHVYDWVLHRLNTNVRRKKLEIIAKDYVAMDIGGEAIWDMGQYISTQQQGFDGYILLYPFLCMPEVTLRGIIEGQSPDPFYMPIQFYSIDEHTAFEGLRTRMETFINLMESNRENNIKFKNKYKEPPEISKIFDGSINLAKEYFSNVILDSVDHWLEYIMLLVFKGMDNKKDKSEFRKIIGKMLFKDSFKLLKNQ